MGKIILISILFATVVVPAGFARDPSAHRGFKRMLASMIVCCLLYVAILVLVYGPFFVPDLW